MSRIIGRVESYAGDGMFVVRMDCGACVTARLLPESDKPDTMGNVYTRAAIESAVPHLIGMRVSDKLMEAARGA